MQASTHAPRKRFGQNFLQDPLIIQAIIDAAGLSLNDTVVEIGPGLGALTLPILSRVAHLHVVEIDRDIISHLRRTIDAQRLTIHAGDALKFNFSGLGSGLKIIGNLPYNISTPLLFHLAEYQDQVTDMHFMLQKEVVDRMVAEPNCNDYGRLSVMLQYRFEMESLIDVPPTSFFPPPKVDSAVVRLIPVPERVGKALSLEDFSALVLKAFGQRRKTVRNTLKGLLSEEDFLSLGVDPNARAESIAVVDFVRLANFWTKKKATNQMTLQSGVTL